MPHDQTSVSLRGWLSNSWYSCWSRNALSVANFVRNMWRYTKLPAMREDQLPLERQRLSKAVLPFRTFGSWPWLEGNVYLISLLRKRQKRDEATTKSNSQGDETPFFKIWRSLSKKNHDPKNMISPYFWKMLSYAFMIWLDTDRIDHASVSRNDGHERTNIIASVSIQRILGSSAAEPVKVTVS